MKDKYFEKRKIKCEVIKAVTLGHAVGDALGVPAEFCDREALSQSPIADMIGGGTYSMPAGTWSDDTSMSLCALDVLAKGECDFDKIMDNFGKWLMGEDFTASGEVFDVGIACKNSIIAYHSHKKSYKECGQRSEYSNGNGSLMRIYPFVLYLLMRDGEITKDNLELVYEASALTHAHMRSLVGCGIYACILEALINEPTEESIKKGLLKAEALLAPNEELSQYNRIFKEDFERLPVEDISSDGYVVSSLEAAIWCILTTNNYKSCVLKAVNLGEDTDTVAAVAGSLAGALYGLPDIPSQWLRVLLRREYIESLCDRLHALIAF